MATKYVEMQDGVLMERQMRYEDAETGREIRFNRHLTPVPNRPGFLIEDGTKRLVKATQLTEFVVAVDDPVPSQA